MQRSGVRPSVPSVHIQRDSPGGSTRRGKGTFPAEYYEDEHTCMTMLYQYVAGTRMSFNLLPAVGCIYAGISVT